MKGQRADSGSRRENKAVKRLLPMCVTREKVMMVRSSGGLSVCV